jgi:hypothetical protein
MKTLFTTAIAATMLTAGAFTIDSSLAQSTSAEFASSSLAAHHLYHQRVENIDPVISPNLGPVQSSRSVSLEGAMGFTQGVTDDGDRRRIHQRVENIDPVLRPGSAPVRSPNSISLEGAMGFTQGSANGAVYGNRQYTDAAGTSALGFTSPR